jgi:hypothetical protein
LLLGHCYLAAGKILGERPLFVIFIAVGFQFTKYVMIA